MAVIIFVGFCLAAYGALLFQFWIFLKKLDIEDLPQPQTVLGEPATDRKLTMKDDIPWEKLGDEPVYGDTSDLGAVDVAIKIKDLQGFKEQAQTNGEFHYYKHQIMLQCDRLVNLTLIQVAPLEIPEDEMYVTPPPKNLIPFGKVKAFKKRKTED